MNTSSRKPYATTFPMLNGHCWSRCCWTLRIEFVPALSEKWISGKSSTHCATLIALAAVGFNTP